MCNDLLASIDGAQALQKKSKIKVWSLVISVFGDLATDRDTTLSGGFLNALFQHMGFKPETLRVALHRLKKDGWIETEKDGRRTLYRLSEHGLGETQRAYPRVYNTEPPQRQNWYLLILKEPIAEVPDGWYEIAPRTFLSTTKSDDVFSIAIGENKIPQWVCYDIAPEDSHEDVAVLNEFLDQVKPTPRADPWHNLATRSLILHQWRRIALRETSWVQMILQPDGAFAQCHKATHRILNQLPRDIPNET